MLMIMIESVFFAKEGEKGLNETSAAHICALAAQTKTEAESRLSNLSFLDTTVNIIGSNARELPVSLGLRDQDLDEIKGSIMLCADMNAVISWFSEARKYLEAEKSSVRASSLSDYLKEIGEEKPTAPINEANKFEDYTLDDAISELSIKDRQQYLYLEAKASTLGQLLHPHGDLKEAMKEYYTKLYKPYTVEGDGRDIVAYKNTPTVSKETLKEFHDKLQVEYRKNEQSLNHMKADLRKKVELKNKEIFDKKYLASLAYDGELKLYNNAVTEMNTKYRQWQREKLAELSKVKFAIPIALEKSITYLNGLGK